MLNDNEIVRQIQSLSDDDLLRLAEYAERAIRAEELETQLSFPKDLYEPKDVVLAVIINMLDNSEVNKFDPTKGTFENWLRTAITFKIKNLIRRKSSREELVDENEDEEYQQNVEWLKPETETPETTRIREERSERIWMRVYELVGSDKELVDLVGALESGIDLGKSKELAEVLKWEMAKVSNAKKRFLRRIKGIEEDFRSVL